MKKRILCGVLSTAVLLGAFPLTAFAEDAPIHTLDTKEMDFREVNEDKQGEGWYWDANGQTLKLDGFRYSVPSGKLEESAAIYLPKESYVEIIGDDNLLETKSFHCDAFYCEGEVNFYGDGSLTLALDSFGANAIYVEKGPILFDDEVEITFESDGYLIYLKDAKGKEPLISVQDDAKLRFEAAEHKDRNILLTKKSSTNTSANWLDYAEVEDDWDKDYMTLVAKDKAAKPEKEDPEESETPEEPEETEKTSEYQIVIGKADILKDGTVAYTSDVLPYLNQDGYTMLPLRALLQVSDPDQKVTWNNGTKSAHTFIGQDFVSIRSGDPTYTKASEKITLYTPAETKDGRLFVSLRDWMKIMEIDVSQMNWDPVTKTVTMRY